MTRRSPPSLLWLRTLFCLYTAAALGLLALVAYAIIYAYAG